jgi:hypothetical protein
MAKVTIKFGSKYSPEEIIIKATPGERTLTICAPTYDVDLDKYDVKSLIIALTMFEREMEPKGEGE